MHFDGASHLDQSHQPDVDQLLQQAANRLAATSGRDVPRATARLQLNRDFRFEHATALVDYYDALGISHLYVSPILVARQGSTHGYDVVDPTRINPELGGEGGLRRLCAALHERGMGLVVDIVPNHMAVGKENPWWQDVLCQGRGSRYARWFDIEWEPADAALKDKVLLPFLGKPYAQALEEGELQLRFDAQHGQIYVEHFEHRFPLALGDYAAVLETAGSQRLAPAIAAFRRLDEWQGSDVIGQATSGWQLLRELAQDEDGMADIDAALAAFTPGQPQAGLALHELLERQHYRLAYWRNAGDEINWRRFFEVSELVGMRVEEEDVFDEMHATLFRLYAEGLIDGVRLDHIDGLTDPAGYCHRLRQRLRLLRAGHEPYIVAEKILAPDETLPADWQLDGTTGYEFMDQCAAVLHDPEGESVLDELWRSVSHGVPDAGTSLHDYAGMVAEARRGFTQRNFAAEFNALAHCLHRLARSTVQTRDVSLMSIKRSLTEMLAVFPMYRTYATAEGMPAAQRETLAKTVLAAAANLHAADHATLHILEGWLGGDLLHPVKDETRHGLQLRAIARFQQLTPPMAAKSVEDTSFYRYGRLLSRNEVGSEPEHFALPLQAFHQLALQRMAQTPFSLLATGTHDHKRGEDARMRLAALGEVPEEWRTLVRHWQQLNAPIAQRNAGEQGAIDAVDEYMLYQTLVGVWPDEAHATGDSLQLLEKLSARVSEWQRKALREGKRRSDWVAPQEAYENACTGFTHDLLCDPGSDGAHHRFVSELSTFVRRLAPIGAINSLAQTMLKLTTPGVPDLYQGAEFWDLSLVDPDNRTPVDFDQRRKTLAQSASLPVSLREWRRGGVKQQLMQTVLAYRREHASWFSRGAYLPLVVEGKAAPHVIAFARVAPDVPAEGASEGARAVLVVCTRLSSRLLPFDGGREDSLPLVPVEAWADTRIVIPQALLDDVGEAGCRWRSVLTSGHGPLNADDGIAVADILGSLPVELVELCGHVNTA